jgi:hypothetical protein
VSCTTHHSGEHQFEVFHTLLTAQILQYLSFGCLKFSKELPLNVIKKLVWENGFENGVKISMAGL